MLRAASRELIASSHRLDEMTVEHIRSSALAIERSMELLKETEDPFPTFGKGGSVSECVEGTISS